jgi:hypothetical protein
MAVAAFFYYRGRFYDAYYWAAVYMITMSLPFLHAFLTDRFILYEGVYIYLVLAAIFTLPTMFLSTDKIELDPAVLASVMKYFSAGVIAFLIGYNCGLGQKIAAILPTKPLSVSKDVLNRASNILYLIGWLSRFFLFLLRSFHAQIHGWQITNTIINDSILIALMIDAYFILSYSDTKEKRIKRLIRFPILFILEIIRNFASGMARDVTLPFAMIIAVYLKARKKVPVFSIIIMAIIFLTVINPLTKAFRLRYWEGVSFKESFQYSVKTVSGATTDEKAMEAIKRLANPLEMAVYCYEIRTRGVKVGIYRDFLDFISRFIPRVLWPDKPIVDYNLLGKKLGVLPLSDYKTSAGVPLVAMLILSMGFVGVIVGLFLTGIIIRCYWHWLMVRTNEVLFAYILYLKLMITWSGEYEFMGTIYGNVAVIVYFLTLIKILTLFQSHNYRKGE